MTIDVLATDSLLVVISRLGASDLREMLIHPLD